MKRTFKLLLLLMALLSLYSACEKEQEKIKPFADPNFLKALIELGVDSDADGKISNSEAEAITSLYLAGEGIKDLTGIELFINLTYLNCSDNQLFTLNVSSNTELVYLDCSINSISTLDLSGLIVLRELYCVHNQLSDLDISNNPDLRVLSCGINPISALDFSANASLSSLFCSFCLLTTLDISQNKALMTVTLAFMHTLTEVCVWETPFPPEGVSVDTTDSPNAYFTSECNN